MIRISAMQVRISPGSRMPHVVLISPESASGCALVNLHPQPANAHLLDHGTPRSIKLDCRAPRRCLGKTGPYATLRKGVLRYSSCPNRGMHRGSLRSLHRNLVKLKKTPYHDPCPSLPPNLIKRCPILKNTSYHVPSLLMLVA